MIWKSQFGLIVCAAYVVIAALTFVHDLRSKPGLLILFDKLLPVVALPGLILIDVPLELLGVKVNDEPVRTLTLLAAVAVTAVIVYLLGAGVESLFKSAISERIR